MPHAFHREHYGLQRRILRHVGRLVEDLEGLQVLPVRVRRVRESPLREGVGSEQVAELVLDQRDRWAGGGDRDSEQGRREPDAQDRRPPATIQSSPDAFERTAAVNELRSIVSPV